MQWIREWILDETTTHAEVKQFLKWVTGSAGTPPQGIFFVDSHRARSYPVVHTCANTIEISPLPYNDEEIPAYDSKEGWIALIKQLMEETAFTTL